MNNVRTEESGNRNDGNAGTITSNSGQSVADGGSVRTDDRNKQATDNRSTGGQSRTLANDVVTSELSGGHSRNEITSGYYYAPNGDIRQLGDGEYIDARDGKLKRRRKRRSGNNAINGNEDRTNYEDREQAGNGESEFDSQVDLRKPVKVRGRKKRTVKEENKKLTMVTLLASGCSALFTSVALLTKHDHWQLRNDCKPTEAAILAEAINDALDTLPAKYYDIVTSIVEKWIPWINLIFVVSALVYDRIEQSEKLIEATRYRAREGSDPRYTNGAAQASNVGGNSSLGFGQ